MKLKHIHIDKYKVFKDFDIDFCHNGIPQKMIIIAGINGSGKTTLLKDVIMDAEKYSSFCNVEFEREGLSGEDEGIIFYIDSNYGDAEDLKKAIIEYVDKQIYEEGRTATEAYIDIRNKINSIFDGFNLQVRFFGLNRNKELLFTGNQGDVFDMEGLSSGEKHILSNIFSFMLMGEKDAIILIDQPEDSLHPVWQNRLVSLLRTYAEQNNCQFILATHSPQIISSARKEELRLLKRGEDGNIEVQSDFTGAYGWTVERVLTDIQGVKYLRVPEVEKKLEQLRSLIADNRYDTPEFKERFADMEALLGLSDIDIVAMRLEIMRKKKQA